MTKTLTISKRSSIECRPRWATKRTPSRKTLGHQVAAAAESFGQPLMPWQRLVADIGLELLPGTMIPAYREILITVPRQNGKTTLMLAFEVQRALGWLKPQGIAYTAQTGKDAREKLLNDQAPLLENKNHAISAGVSQVLRGIGNEAIIFRTGSRIFILNSGEDSGHGKTLDLGVIDESFADEDDRREQAMLPAMLTRPSAQILNISTMGTEKSAYLNRKVDMGRDVVARGITEGMAYFEWSADEDADIDDPATWYSCMPALGHTITEDVVRHARLTMTEGDFRRAMCNQRTISEERVIPAALWNDACGDTVTPDGKFALGLDVNPERSAAAIGIADDQGRAELVEFHPGLGWVVKRAAEISKKWDAPVVLDTYGPAASLTTELEAEGVEVKGLTTREYAQACASFYDGIADGKVSMRRNADLDLAAAAARRRQTGDTWVWGRKDVGEDISPLIAVNLAYAGAQTGGSDSNVWLAY